MITTSATAPHPHSSRDEVICFHFADEGVKAQDGDRPGIVKPACHGARAAGLGPGCLGRLLVSLMEWGGGAGSSFNRAIERRERPLCPRAKATQGCRARADSAPDPRLTVRMQPRPGRGDALERFIEETSERPLFLQPPRIRLLILATAET